MSRKLADIYHPEEFTTVLRLDPNHEIGTLRRGVVLLTKMRNGSFEVCESANPIELVQTVAGRRNEIDIADNVLGALYAVLFNHFYIRTN